MIKIDIDTYKELIKNNNIELYIVENDVRVETYNAFRHSSTEITNRIIKLDKLIHIKIHQMARIKSILDNNKIYLFFHSTKKRKLNDILNGIYEQREAYKIEKYRYSYVTSYKPSVVHLTFSTDENEMFFKMKYL